MDSLINDKVELLRSNKGGAKIIYRGYMYTIHKKVHGRIRWRCSQRTLHCKGSITTGRGPPVVNLCHNHIPDMHALARARCKSVLIEGDQAANFFSPPASSVLGPADLIPLHDTKAPLQGYLSAKEMENWQIRRTSRGIRLIDGKGYTYTKDRHVGNKSYWRCDYRPWKCRARASLIGSTSSGDYSRANVMFNLMSHGHLPTLKRKSKENIDTENEMEDSSSSKSVPKQTGNTNRSPIKITKSPEPAPKSPPPSPDSEMCLRWNSHHANMSTVIPALMDDEKYVDVTLMAEGKILKCHKLILSSCSTYFDEMLKSTVSNQQTVVFLRGIEYWQMKALVDFMYKGEVNIDQSKLESLLKAAEDLQIKGLAGKGTKQEPDPQPEPEPEVSDPPVLEQKTPDRELKSEKDNFVDNSTMDEDDEEYFPHVAYRRGKYKKNRKRKINTPPDPSLLKHVKINLRGTKSRPNIKQPKFFSPDFPEYDPDRCVSPPKEETDPLIHIDNIKIEPIDIEVPQSPTFFEMNTMMDKSLTEKSTPEPQVKPPVKVAVKSDTKTKEIKVYSRVRHEEKNKEVLPSTSKEGIPEKSNKDNEPVKITLPTAGSSKEVMNINKKAIIVKCQNVKKFMDDTSSIQKIIDAATTKSNLSDTEKSKLPQIRVRNLPTTDTVLKKFATTQLTSILKKGEGQSIGQGTQRIILKKIGGTKPTIIRHSLPAKTEQFTTEIQEDDNKGIVEKLTLLTKTKKELEEKPEKDKKEDKSDGTRDNE